MATVRFTGNTVPNVGITATGGPFGFDDPVIPLQVIKYDIRDGKISVECDVVKGGVKVSHRGGGKGDHCLPY